MSITPVRFNACPTYAPRFSGGGTATGGTAEPATPQPRPRKRLNLLQKAGLTVAALGALLSIGLGVKADHDYNGKVDIIPTTAEEKYQIQRSGIPGILVLGLGSLVGMVGKERNKSQRRREAGAKDSGEA